ncbi:glycosyltransferase family 4 protein [Pseudobutyrivibrio sp. UC1225]|uniref:glycosyltransferase family 4 protein n=1 Tax=Pseudobutyrivibrio sp. UC1225 TaxID=1798185 RepID=UPI000B844381|nr:glycosyltransferase family 4 protein [Pseudobutyrivibrio sp. UC1225]
MKILHIALASHFTVGMLYQENQMINCQRADGHEVTIITDLYHYEHGELVKGSEEDTIMDNGARLIRLKWDRIFFSDLWTEKIRKSHKVKKLLKEIQPDTILFHGLCGYEIMTVADYCKSNPDCLFFVDCHSDYNGSARTFLSKNFYKFIHGHFITKASLLVDKFFYTGEEMRYWMNDLFVIPKDRQEFLATGGTIYTAQQQKDARMELIKKYALPQDAIILAHSAKLIDEKSRTKELIEAFRKVNDPRLTLFIFGFIAKEMSSEIRSLIESDNRIHFMGWKVSTEIEEFLAGVDMYCQPGGRSTTFETAMCCGCVNMTYPLDTYKDENYTDCNFENYFFVENEEDIVKVLKDITENVQVLEQAKAKSFSFARLNFDYAVISRRIYTL